MKTMKEKLLKRLDGVLSEIAASEANVDDAEDKVRAFYGNLHFSDEGIDDGVTDEDSTDDYVMYRSYWVAKDGEELHFAFYYGNNNETIGSYRIYQ